MGPARKGPDVTTYAGRCAERLRALRDKTGLTVEALAEAVGRKTRTLYNWESGATAPSLDDLPRLAEAFGLKSPRAVLAEK